MCTNSYGTPSGSYRVELSQVIIDKLYTICQNARNEETGGILIGSYSSDQLTAYITDVTGAPRGSIQTGTTFYRANTGLIDVLDTLWKQGVYYLGDWHFHPKARARPSRVDIIQMQQFSRDVRLKCPEPILVIIGGGKRKWEIGIYLITGNNDAEMVIQRDQCHG